MQADLAGKLRHSLLLLYSAIVLLVVSSFSWSKNTRAVLLPLSSKGHTGRMAHNPSPFLHLCRATNNLDLKIIVAAMEPNVAPNVSSVLQMDII